jgi:uncharacterized membrane protein required for colicin V production
VNGAIVESLNLFGLIGGTFVASRVANATAEVLSSALKLSSTNPAMVETTIFFIVLGFSLLLSKLLINYFQKYERERSFLSKTVGYFVGVVKYFAIFSIFFAIFSTVPTLKKRVVELSANSSTYNYMINYGAFIINRVNRPDKK